MEATIRVTYFHQSGFSVASGDTLLIFDYWRGDEGELDGVGITADELKSYAHVIVFVSSTREDQFDKVIYEWDQPGVSITYLVPQEIKGNARGKRMKPGEELKLFGVRIQTFSSTDIGVSYFVTVNGVTVFHGGGLNLWHWREESSLSDIVKAERDFDEAMAPIEKLHIDLAMFTLDPRMGGMFDAGANHFIMAVKPRMFIPMHWLNRREIALDYARRAKTRYTEVIALTHPREQMDVTFRDSSISWKVSTAALPEKEEVTLDSLNQEDNPFAESDLPVSLDSVETEGPKDEE